MNQIPFKDNTRALPGSHVAAVSDGKRDDATVTVYEE